MVNTSNLRNKLTSKTAKSAITTSARAGLLLPTPKIVKMMRRDRLAPSVGVKPGIVMTAVCEYLCGEILDLAATIAQENRKKRIVPRHIMLAVSQDEELSKYLHSAIFTEAGVVPNIPKALQPKGGKGGSAPTQHGDMSQDA